MLLDSSSSVSNASVCEWKYSLGDNGGPDRISSSPFRCFWKSSSVIQSRFRSIPRLKVAWPLSLKHTMQRERYFISWQVETLRNANLPCICFELQLVFVAGMERFIVLQIKCYLVKCKKNCFQERITSYQFPCSFKFKCPVFGGGSRK